MLKFCVSPYTKIQDHFQLTVISVPWFQLQSFELSIPSDFFDFIYSS